MLQKLLDLIHSNQLATVLGALWAVCEVLANNPKIAANSVFHAIYLGLKWAKDKVLPAPPAA